MDKVLPMDPESAIQIAEWKYEHPYDIYSLNNTPETLFELLNGDYFVVIDKLENRIKGFYCYGKSARISTDSNVYETDALDIGLGMAPEFCGKGNGFDFVRKALLLGEYQYSPEKFRLTVADFNVRAIRVYEKSGFRQMGTVIQEKTRIPFIIMIKDIV